MTIGSGVTMRKFRKPGVIASRFAASDKKAKSSSCLSGNHCSASKDRTRMNVVLSTLYFLPSTFYLLPSNFCLSTSFLHGGEIRRATTAVNDARRPQDRKEKHVNQTAPISYNR